MTASLQFYVNCTKSTIHVEAYTPCFQIVCEEIIFTKNEKHKSKAVLVVVVVVVVFIFFTKKIKKTMTSTFNPVFIVSVFIIVFDFLIVVVVSGS